MGTKRKFRKAYIVCENNSVFADYKMTDIFLEKGNAQSTCEARQRKLIEESKMAHWPKDRPVPKLSVHGFYLVHESLFDEILKPHTI